ncbi:MAG: hypothetical protein KME26_30230 [Oscillatoria princeps RMCB-10]|jgi:uncharacterized coiled-coil DUF342 family protein|nr:hypothetical protein [Oscillatoria princeps RMCB-10]
MKDTPERNGLELTESISVAGSVAGTIMAVVSQQLIYAAAPLSLALSLSLINRRRFEQSFEQNIAAVLAEMGNRVTQSDRQLSGEMQAVRNTVAALQAAPQQAADFNPIKEELFQLQKRFDTLEEAINSFKEAADSDESQEMAELFPAFDPSELLQQIQQLQKNVSLLAEAFNQRPEASRLQELNQLAASLQQQLEALPQTASTFDPTPLHQEIQQVKTALAQIPTNQAFDPAPLQLQIQQLQGSISLLTQAFNSRLEPQHIEELKRSAASLKQELEALPAPFDPTPLARELQELKAAVTELQNIPAFDPTPQEQQIQLLQGTLSSLSKAFNHRSEPQLIEELRQSAARVKQQLEALTAPFDLTALEQQIEELKIALSERPNTSAFDPTVLEREIEELKAALAEQPNTPAFDPTVLEREIEELKAALAEQPNTPAFDPTVLEREIEELKAALAERPNTPAFDPTVLEREIEELKAALAEQPNTPAFDPTVLEREIEELKAALAERPNTPAFDPTPLELQIQQLQANLSSLTEAFNQRSESQQIEELRQSAASVKQQVEALPAPYDPSELKGEIQQLKGEIQSLRQLLQDSLRPVESAHTHFNAEIAKLPPLAESFAQMQQQLLQLQKLTAKLDEKTKQQEEKQLLSSIVASGAASSKKAEAKNRLTTPQDRLQFLIGMAQQHGIGREFLRLVHAGKQHQLTLNPWPTHLMFSPPLNLIAKAPSNWSNCLFGISAQPESNGKVKLWVSSQAFANFYPSQKYNVPSILGSDGWREMESLDMEGFVFNLESLFEKIDAESNS